MKIGIKLRIPIEIEYMLEQLEKNGFEAYVVGGAVRNLLMGIEPCDWDIASSAPPEAVKSIFDRTADTGITHGTVTVIQGRCCADVTTYRKESGYSDSRHPDTVEFISDLQEDLKRRDFTINAIAYNPRTGCVDYFYGMDDIRRRIVRCIGKAEERFREDALRMLRAVRFATTLGFIIENGTYRAIERNISFLYRISAERIRKELDGILCSGNCAEGLKILRDTGLIYVIAPEFIGLDRHVFDAMSRWIRGIENNHAAKLAAMLYCLGYKQQQSHCSEMLLRMKYDSRTVKETLHLLKYMDMKVSCGSVSVRKAMSIMGAKNFGIYINIQKARAPVYVPAADVDAEIKRLERMEKIYTGVIESKQAVSVKDLAINGDDLIAAGIAEGTAIGNTLDYLLDKVIVEPELNEKGTLLEMAAAFNSNQP